MAFTDTDKTCLRDYHTYLQRKERSGKLSDTDKADLDTILTGEEAAKIVAAKWFAENVRLVEVDARLAGLDAEKATLLIEKADLARYIA